MIGHRNSTDDRQDVAAAAAVKDRLVTRDFFVIMLANFVNFLSVQMLVAALPLYVIKLGGTKAAAGMVAGAMGITAMIFRPFMGWLTDTFRRRRIVSLGIAFHGLASVAYLVANSVPILMIGRALHGFGSSGYNTASTAYIADIAPPRRRAEAMGLFSATTALGQIIGPAVGFMILRRSTFHDLFMITSGLAFLSVVMSFFLRESRIDRPVKREPWTLRNGIISRDALPAAWIILCIGIGLGSVQTFTAIFALPRGLANPGIFFTVQAVGVLLSRTFTGHVADRFGRAAVLIPGITLMVLGLVLLPWVHSVHFFLTVAALYGLGYGAAMPASMALLIDCVRPEQRGLASSTYFLGLDVGTSTGSVLMGFVSQHLGFGVMWPLTAAFTLLGLGGLLKARPAQVVSNSTAPVATVR